MTATVTSKGQVTIPKRVRDHLGIHPGSTVDFQLAPDGRVTLVHGSSTSPAPSFGRLRGTAGPGMSTEEIMALTRGNE